MTHLRVHLRYYTNNRYNLSSISTYVWRQLFSSVPQVYYNKTCNGSCVESGNATLQYYLRQFIMLGLQMQQQ